MRRRQLLRTGGAVLASAAGAGVVAGDEADPRPVQQAGTRPNPNVPATDTGALGRLGENSEIPAGDWIVHDNGWANFPSKAAVAALATGTTQTYSIDDTTFILDSFDDWEFVPEHNGLNFEYVTPPKPKGTTYEVRWELEAHDEAFAHWEEQFPFSNQVEVVGRK